MENQIPLSWKLTSCPSLDNEVHRLVKKMNRNSKLPWPYSKLAILNREKLKSKLINLKNANFNYDFYCAFGNLYGEGVWFTNTYILDYAPVYFGNHITIGPDVKIITSWHEVSNFNIVKALPIIIEDNVWITMNAIILPGVTIGKNSIIAAGSIINKSVPPNSLVGGNPGRVIKAIDRDYPYWEDLERDIEERKNENKKSVSHKQYVSLLPSILKRPIKKALIFFK